VIFCECCGDLLPEEEGREILETSGQNPGQKRNLCPECRHLLEGLGDSSPVWLASRGFFRH